jgi:ABC-2 type transport system ATP-binding protein
MRRDPNHGAVAVRVAQARAESVVRRLASHAGVARVETLNQADGHVALRAVPGNGGPIASDVASLLHEMEVPVDELYVERGKLDDVFREITSSEQGGKDA